jgi:hypothetical protein
VLSAKHQGFRRNQGAFDELPGQKRGSDVAHDLVIRNGTVVDVRGSADQVIDAGGSAA